MTSIQKELYNAYIGGIETPFPNALAYYPLTDDTLDTTGNTTISGGTWTKASVGYNVSCTNSSANLSAVAGIKFISGWVKFNSSNNFYISALSGWAGFYFKHYESRLNNKFYVFYNSSFSAATSNATGIRTGTRKYICYGNDNGTWRFYINGSEFFNTTQQPYTSLDSGIGMFSSTDRNYTDNADISDVIICSTMPTAQEISDYFSNTKSLYGIN